MMHASQDTAWDDASSKKQAVLFVAASPGIAAALLQRCCSCLMRCITLLLCNFAVLTAPSSTHLSTALL
jgi:hypothetical protein